MQKFLSHAKPNFLLQAKNLFQYAKKIQRYSQFKLTFKEEYINPLFSIHINTHVQNLV